MYIFNIQWKSCSTTKIRFSLVFQGGKTVMKFYLEAPSLRRKKEALEYLEEHQKYNSNINGTGGMDKCLKGMSYEDWLIKSEKMKSDAYAKSINKCPAETYFLVRKEDDKIIGMINIRHHLTDEMLRFGGHIGYGIRPTERKRGYNKINLFLGLMKARERFGLDTVMVGCSADNIGSDKTIQALGGVLERSEIDPSDTTLTNVYWINIEESINRYYNVYSNYIDFEKNTSFSKG